MRGEALHPSSLPLVPPCSPRRTALQFKGLSSPVGARPGGLDHAGMLPGISPMHKRYALLLLLSGLLGSSSPLPATAQDHLEEASAELRSQSHLPIADSTVQDADAAQRFLSDRLRHAKDLSNVQKG